MADMLVKLYNIPDSRDLEKRLLEEGIRIKKSLVLHVMMPLPKIFSAPWPCRKPSEKGE